MAQTRLTPDQVRSIFTSAEPNKVLVARYGVARRMIWAIQSRTTHARLTADLTRPKASPRPTPVKRRKPHLKPEQIRSVFVSTEPPRELASQFNVSTFTIYAIQNRTAHSKITADLPDVVRVRRRGRVPKPKPKPEPVRPNIVITLTDDQIRSIFTSTESDRAEAERHNVKIGLIRNIRDRSIFGYTTMDLRRPRVSSKTSSTTQALPELKSPPTPGIDFADLAKLHQNLERPKGSKGTIRFRADYKDAPTIVAYLISLDSQNRSRAAKRRSRKAK